MARQILAVIAAAATLGWGVTHPASAQQKPHETPTQDHHAHESPPAAMSATAPHEHDHGPAAPAVTYADLQRTTDQLTAARQATMKYLDVRAAEADGYHAVGPDVPGMGIHYVRDRHQDDFSITKPPILLYERDAESRGGLRLVGVSYLLVAPGGADEQPASAPFPKALARWHKHNNICVLPDNTATVNLSETQCTSQRGTFTGETSWMLHAWIWKDSPTGVFSPTNPLVQ
jgi:hypothetical protein